MVLCESCFFAETSRFSFVSRAFSADLGGGGANAALRSSSGRATLAVVWGVRAWASFPGTPACFGPCPPVPPRIRGCRFRSALFPDPSRRRLGLSPACAPGPAWAWAVVSVSAAQSGAGPGRAPRERSRQQPLPGPSPAPASATVCPPGLLLVVPWPESWGASTARAPVGPAAGPVRSSPRPVLRAPNPACRVALCGGSGSRHGCPARARSPLRLDGMGTPVTLRVARRFPRGVHGVLLLASISVPEAPRV